MQFTMIELYGICTLCLVSLILLGFTTILIYLSDLLVVYAIHSIGSSQM